jgi:perosamine synthetase
MSIKNTLAILGGTPVRNSPLPYGKQLIDEDDINEVIKVLKGDFLTTGPSVLEFEKSVANYVKAKYAVAVSSGTAALHMACFAAGITKGDEVIVSSMTFAASSNAVLYCGGTPVFADIDSKTYNIDVSKIESLITNNTKAIIPVDFTGQSVDMDKIIELAKKYNLIIIEDGAHALGSEYKGKKVGTSADMVMFSFHPVKPVTTAEGGIITTNNEDFYNKMLLFRTHGITRKDNLLIENHGPWYYEQQILGYHYRLTDVQSALGKSQMQKIDKFIERRREIASIYNDKLKDIKELLLPFEESYSNSGWHIYVVQIVPDLLKVEKKVIFEALLAENIIVNVHYLPVYMHPYYRDLGYMKGLCPESEALYKNMFTIPIFPSMTNDDVNDVINALKKVLGFYRR